MSRNIASFCACQELSFLLKVSMHTVLSGPYETLYTTAVDMWSFGCLCLNICIGKTAAVKQREVSKINTNKGYVMKNL